MLRRFVPITALLGVVAACRPDAQSLDWTCDFDASVARPVGDPGATADDAGHLAPNVCQDTCGPPATSCTATTLDGGIPGAICPVCTF
jgi:hypothetical protein